MTRAVVDSPDNEQAQAWWFPDTLVVEHRCAPGMGTVVLEMTLPPGSAPPRHVHDDLDDTWYILEGRMAVRCGDDEFVTVPTGPFPPGARTIGMKLGVVDPRWPLLATSLGAAAVVSLAGWRSSRQAARTLSRLTTSS